MKSLLLVLGVLILASPIAFSQPTVVFDGSSGDDCFVGDSLWVFGFGGESFYIAIANPDAAQTNVRFSVQLSTLGIPPGVTPVQIRFLNGFDTLFGSAPSAYTETIADGFILTIEASVSGTGIGLPASPDTIRYISIETEIDVGMDFHASLAIDSVESPTHGTWSFTPGPAPMWLPHPDEPSATWPAIYDLVQYVGITPFQFTFPPAAFQSNTWCQSFSYPFVAEFWLMGVWSHYYTIVDGPGEIDSTTGMYTYVPNPAHAGDTLDVMIAVMASLCDPDGHGPFWESDYAELQLFIGDNQPPTFDVPTSRYVTTTGQAVTIDVPVTDEDPCTGFTWSWFVDPGDPMPTMVIDTLSGLPMYMANNGDTNTYVVHLVVTEGDYADTSLVSIYHWDTPMCGDMDHSSSIDIVDLTWLVGFAFSGGVSPAPPDAGDVNCNPGTDISDITYLVRYMFSNGTAPCNCN